MDKIPNFTIGTSYAEVKDFLATSNLDEKQKASIFSMINDDETIGDGKITNKGELQILNKQLKGVIETIVLKDPSYTREKDNPEETVIKKDIDFSFSKGFIVEETLENNKGFKRYYYSESEKDIKDYYYGRTENINSEEKNEASRVYEIGDTDYYDSDLDGTFEAKKVGDKLYIRVDGEWKETDVDFNTKKSYYLKAFKLISNTK